MTRSLLLLAACLSLVLATDLDRQFGEFRARFGKKYESAAEHQYRLGVFSDNVKKINNHNRLRSNTYRMAVNEFADLTEEEFKDTFLGGYKRLPQSGAPQEEKENRVIDLPESVDWREAGVVTDPKNQGSCGSCWAFATVEMIESYAALNNVSLMELSTQEVTTCTPNPLHCGGTGGCRGSIPQLGYNYVQLFGLTTEKEYPYWSGITGMTGNCKYDVERRTPVVGITGYNTLPSNDMDAVLNHLATVGPLAIAGDATRWQFYGSGVFSGCDYDSNISLNHAIMLVGYGTDIHNGDYWLVRNSWGRNWGEHGYMRLARESSLTCGVNSTPMDGTACVGGPGTDQQTVCGMCGMLFDSSYPLGAYQWHA